MSGAAPSGGSGGGSGGEALGPVPMLPCRAAYSDQPCMWRALGHQTSVGLCALWHLGDGCACGALVQG